MRSIGQKSEIKRVLLVLFVALTACEGRRWNAPRILSPSDGASIAVPWVPVHVRLPSGTALASVEISLDGEPWVDPVALVAPVWPRIGSGEDYLAELDLTGREPGAHRLEVRVSDGASASAGFTWNPPPCAVDLEVVDGRGHPSAARVLVRGPDGALLSFAAPDAGRSDPTGRDARIRSLVVDGRRRIHLGRGAHLLTAARSVRHGLGRARIVLEDRCAEPASVRLAVPRVVPTPDHVTADLHVHTGRSPDASVPHGPRFRSLVAADLDVIAITDHNRTWDPEAVARRIRGDRERPVVLAGVEARIGPFGRSVGHLNALPLSVGAPLPVSDPLDLATHLDAFRERQRRAPDATAGDELLLQLNHPRGLQVLPEEGPGWFRHALFNRFGYDRRVPIGEGSNAWLTRARPGTGTTALDVDAIEVLNRFSTAHHREVREDWFTLLNHGRFPTGTGNSDSHSLAVELAGFPVNLVRLPGAATGAPDVTRFVEAVRGGALSVSTGPVVELSVEGRGGAIAFPGGRIPAGKGAVTVRVEVRAAPWVPVDVVRLVANGEVVHEQAVSASSSVERARVEWRLPVDRDTWVLAEAGFEGGPGARLGDYALVAPGHVPLGFTNPVRIDDGDGVWTPLGAAEAARRARPLPAEITASDYWPTGPRERPEGSGERRSSSGDQGRSAR